MKVNHRIIETKHENLSNASNEIGTKISYKVYNERFKKFLYIIIGSNNL